jgi:hypothetical protein
MADGCRGDTETPAAQASEAVACEREDEPFGCAAAVFRNRPAADFRISQLLAASASDFGLDALP